MIDDAIVTICVQYYYDESVGIVAWCGKYYGIDVHSLQATRTAVFRTKLARVCRAATMVS